MQQISENADLGKGNIPDFTKMSYIAYLNRQQKSIDVGEDDDISDDQDDDDDDDKVQVTKKDAVITLA